MEGRTQTITTTSSSSTTPRRPEPPSPASWPPTAAPLDAATPPTCASSPPGAPRPTSSCSACAGPTSSCSDGGWRKSAGCAGPWPGGCPPLASFYRYCEQEGLIERNPAANVRRPKVDYESRTLGLDRNELGAFLVQAGLGSARDHALASLLALNAYASPRPSRPTSTTWSSNGATGHSRSCARASSTPSSPSPPHLTGTGPVHRRADDRGRSSSAPSVPDGPLGSGTHRQAPGPTCRDHQAHKRPQPASKLHHRRPRRRRAPARRQEAASDADPRTTMRYDRGRGSLDRHATHVVATVAVRGGRGRATDLSPDRGGATMRRKDAHPVDRSARSVRKRVSAAAPVRQLYG